MINKLCLYVCEFSDELELDLNYPDEIRTILTIWSRTKRMGSFFWHEKVCWSFSLKKKKNHLVEELVIDLALQQGFCMPGTVTVLYPARTTIHGQISVHSSIFVCRALPQEVVLSVFQLLLSWITNTLHTRKIQKRYLSYESDMKACLGGWTSIKGSIIVNIIVVIKVVKKIQIIFLIQLTPVNHGWATNVYQVKNLFNNSRTKFITWKRQQKDN